MSKFAIRRALEKQLADAMTAASIPCVFGNNKLDPVPAEYVRARMTWGEDHAAEIGRTGRIERSGKLHVQVRTAPEMLEDRNDIVAGLVRDAFPYGEDLVRDGIQVSIETVDDSDCVPDGSYLYSPVYVKWTVWRTN